MTIATPMINNFDKEEIALWSGERLIDLPMATLSSKPFASFFPWSKEKLNLNYQKLRPRYEPMDEITQTVCEPLCQEGWYFDCETETCKEFDFHPYITTVDLTFKPTVGYNEWESLPIGTGLHSAEIYEGWVYNLYQAGIKHVKLKSVLVTETCWFNSCTKYRPNGANPFRQEQQLWAESYKNFITEAIRDWLFDMRQYDWPNAIVNENYDTVVPTINLYNPDWYLYPLTYCYKYSFTNLPARYIGQEHELAISILKSKYGFKVK